MIKGDYRNWFKKDIFFVGMLLLVAVVSYAGFLVHPCIHDFYNEFFPSRYFLIDCLRNGQLPLWNPYQSMGTPAHADPQMGVFYPPAYLFALFGPYHSICCGIEFILLAFIAGWGFYSLCRQFVSSRSVAFVCAVCYMLSGFFVGNAQHLSWLVSGAWLPWLLYSTIVLLRTPCWRPTVLTAIFASLMFTGGYPGFFFVFAYLLVLLYVAFLVRDWRSHDASHAKQLLSYGLLAAAVFVILSLPAILSFIEVRPLITRGQALDYAQVSNDFPLLTSMLFPYAIVTEPSICASDVTMRSLYVGILALGFMVVGLRRNRSRLLWLLVAFGIVSLLFAYGRMLPFHKIAFGILPFFSLMRIPALMRIFFILPVLLLAAVGLQQLVDGDAVSRLLSVVFIVLTVASLSLFLILTSPLPKHWESETFTSVFFQKLRLDSGILLVISVLALVSLKIQQPRTLFTMVVLITVADMVVHVLLLAPCTIYNKTMRHSDLARITQPKGRTVPQRLSNPSAIQDPEPHLLWQNAGMFYKEVEWDSYNPFMLNNHAQLSQFYRDRNLEMDLPLAFLPAVVLADADVHFLGEDTAYTESGSLAGVYSDSTASVSILRFDPGRIMLKTSTSEPRVLVLAQSPYPGWRCETDGKSLAIACANTSMMAVKVPTGEHEVVFTYRKPALLVSWALELLVFVILLVFLAVKREKE